MLILDEPTSGLDSASAYGVMLRLQAMAKAGHAIMCTIHQPSSELWSVFDKFILLSGGHTIYSGRADHTVQYFGELGHACPTAYNPADYVLGLVNQDFPDRYDDSLPGKYAESQQRAATLAAVAQAIEAGKANPIADAADYGLKPISTFVTLSHRFLLNNARNPGIYWARGACLLTCTPAHLLTNGLRVAPTHPLIPPYIGASRHVRDALPHDRAHVHWAGRRVQLLGDQLAHLNALLHRGLPG